MGECFSKSEEQENYGFQDFYYLYRARKYLLKISNGAVSKFKIDNSIKIRKDSGIGYLSDGRIIVAGGTDSTGCLTNKVYIINPEDSSVSVEPDLPIAVHEGSFFHYKHYAYYIGAMMEGEDEDYLSQEQGAPIMRYHLTDSHWEIFQQEHVERRDYGSYINQSGNNKKKEEDLKLKEILYASSFMIGGKIFLINGQRVDSKGMMKSMQTIFSINIDDEENDFDFKVEKSLSPLKVFRPICGNYNTVAFITGGVNPSNKLCNMDSYIITQEDGELVFELVKGLRANLDDTYPIMSTSKHFVAMAYPSFTYYDLEKQKWGGIILEEELVKRKAFKHQTPALEVKDKNPRKPKKKGNFFVKYEDPKKPVKDRSISSDSSHSLPNDHKKEIRESVPKKKAIGDIYKEKWSESSEDFSEGKIDSISEIKKIPEKISEDEENLSDVSDDKDREPKFPKIAKKAKDKALRFGADDIAEDKSKEKSSEAKHIKESESSLSQKYEKSSSGSSDFESEPKIVSPYKPVEEKKSDKILVRNPSSSSSSDFELSKDEYEVSIKKSSEEFKVSSGVGESSSSNLPIKIIADHNAGIMPKIVGIKKDKDFGFEYDEYKSPKVSSGRKEGKEIGSKEIRIKNDNSRRKDIHKKAKKSKSRNSSSSSNNSASKSN